MSIENVSKGPITWEKLVHSLNVSKITPLLTWLDKIVNFELYEFGLAHLGEVVHFTWPRQLT